MDALVVMNRALANTGNNLLTELNDGSDEWVAADTAFDEAVDDLITRHNWPFARVTADLVPADPADNPSQRFAVAYELPPDALHVRNVLWQGSADRGPVPLLEYELIGRYVCVGRVGSSEQFSSGVSLEYIAAPDDAVWHPQATKILTMYVEAGLLRGLNEDFAAADKRELAAEGRLLEARPRQDMQNPAKDAFLSSTAIARRRRRVGSGGGFGS